MEHVVIAFDLEGSGQYVHANPIVEIGAVVKSMDTGDTIERFACMGQCRLDQFEKRCEDEFWNKKDPDKKRRKMYPTATPQPEMWKLFRDFLKRIYEKFEKVDLVCDNPAYDAMFVTMGMQRYLDGKDLHYVSGTYRYISDSSSFTEALHLSRGLKWGDFETKLLDWYHNLCPMSEKAVHDHNPVNDAAFIANMWIAGHKYAETCGKHTGTPPKHTGTPPF